VGSRSIIRVGSKLGTKLIDGCLLGADEGDDDGVSEGDSDGADEGAALGMALGIELKGSHSCGLGTGHSGTNPVGAIEIEGDADGAAETEGTKDGASLSVFTGQTKACAINHQPESSPSPPCVLAFVTIADLT